MSDEKKRATYAEEKVDKNLEATRRIADIINELPSSDDRHMVWNVVGILCGMRGPE